MIATQIRIEYINAQKQFFAIKIEASELSIMPLAESSYSILYAGLEKNKKTLVIAPPVSKPLPTPQPPPKKIYQERLNRIMLRVKTNLKNVSRTARQRGSVYEIAAAIMRILHQWYINREPEAKIIDANSKAALKILAENITHEVGRKRSASGRQIELAKRIANQCIDGGICSNEALVINDVLDSLYRMRPDIVIGNELLFKEVQKFFVTIGSFLSNQFDKIKQFFSRNEYKKHKRAIINWGDSLPLMELIKAIESGFGVLGLELEQDDFFLRKSW